MSIDKRVSRLVQARKQLSLAFEEGRPAYLLNVLRTFVGAKLVDYSSLSPDNALVGSFMYGIDDRQRVSPDSRLARSFMYGVDDMPEKGALWKAGPHYRDSET